MTGQGYEVEITDTTTGETRVERHEDDWDDGLEYLWSDGNFGCDCNRGLFFGRAGGSDGFDGPCGLTRFTIVVKVDGEIVYDDE